MVGANCPGGMTMSDKTTSEMLRELVLEYLDLAAAG